MDLVNFATSDAVGDVDAFAAFAAAPTLNTAQGQDLEHQLGYLSTAAATALSPAKTNGAKKTKSPASVHKATTSRTAEALRAFKRNKGLCEVEGCHRKSNSKRDDLELCQFHYDNGIDAVEPINKPRKRKLEGDSPPKKRATLKNSPPKASAMDGDNRLSLGVKTPCLIEGCDKLRARGGYCTRHFKDKNAPIRTGISYYERRYCTVEGCERLQSKGIYCHRHAKDPHAPIRNPGEQVPPDAKKECLIERCDRLQVKGGYCSRHFKNPDAPVKDTPAFSFDGDANWDRLFPELEAFAKENGHARYPTTKKTDLAKFVMHIRGVYRQKRNKAIMMNPGADPDTVEPDLSNSKLLTPERVEALKRIGFEFQLWKVDLDQWDARFKELLEYKQKHGNFNVPIRENATLSSWCKTQRQRYKNTMAIYQGLHGAEFSGSQVKASSLYQKAKKMAEEAKESERMLEPSDVTEAKNLLEPSRVCRLSAIGFEWDLQNTCFTESWETRFGELMRYKIVHGNCRVPKTGEHAQLGQWVKQMRKYYTWKQEGKNYPKTFTDERVQRLNELGFEWRLKDANIDQSLRQEPAIDVARRPHQQRDTMEAALHRQVNEKPMTMEEMNRYEPFRANVNIYEQRGWL